MARPAAEQAQYTRRAFLWIYAPLFLWIAVIFFMSSPQGSMSETSRFIGPLLRYLFPDISPEALQTVHFAVRKAAHFTEYSILAFFGLRAFTFADSKIVYGSRFILAFCVAALVASADEFNQSFDPTRTGLASDVLLDVASASVCLIFLWLIGRPRRTNTTDLPADAVE
ncbi:MAG: VanZ family protein [Pyrinomonadaceae bacterium]